MLVEVVSTLAVLVVVALAVVAAAGGEVTVVEVVVAVVVLATRGEVRGAPVIFDNRICSKISTSFVCGDLISDESAIVKEIAYWQQIGQCKSYSLWRRISLIRYHQSHELVVS